LEREVLGSTEKRQRLRKCHMRIEYDIYVFTANT
jgi:hypothetical protein